ncbi:hypothetical protein [Streptomyces clavuligerus]|uniref:Uncharacterized protein n=2 Tax=Streptomyces clavuligerus TaxID=1901 RepID=Q6TMT0_STRCL|nr:hypothetical protein [Streptomyces clavuligerus]AAQ93543.1 hypothetical protein pSCL2.5.424.3 [Streptomyces clavuligerus]EDY48736.1 hypothetical protein SSCG_01764 [Streptomyces clavuligerus]MBY6300979.1 hypothetical protein [Streptomyces clavuligerus]WDN55789.1 hypothetical protein LL058_28245 [Streptomyces clavuligerus]
MPPHTPTRTRTRVKRILRWAARRRRTATMHVLRGICYGLGTTTVTLASLWVQRHT